MGPELAPPPGSEVVDATGKTLTPGFFDLHTHLLAGAVPGWPTDWGKTLKAYLVCGVTTVADLSTYPEQFDPMRRLLRGAVPGPRVLMAARISTPGGHGMEGGRGDFHTQEVMTAREARNAVRRILPYRPDLIKVFTDGWRYGAAPDMTSMDEPTLAALVDEAHKSRIRVVTHTVTLDKAKIAARSKVDIIVHGLGDRAVDEELLSLMKASHTALVSTLAVYQPREGLALPRAFLERVIPPGVVATLKPAEGPVPPARQARWNFLLLNAKALFDGGIATGVGTDAGMPGTYHGEATLHEMELLVQAGLTPMQALVAGTSGSAKLLGVDGDRGTLQVGKAADLVLIDGEPDRSIEDLYKISRVWLGGKEVNRADMAAAIASASPTPIPAVRPVPLLDDFESADGRSRANTLWINNTDLGTNHTKMLYGRNSRSDGGHALMVMAEMSDKDSPDATMVLPLTPGSVEPADLGRFRGVEFEARSDGPLAVTLQLRGESGRRFPVASIQTKPSWQHFRIEFARFAAKGGLPKDWKKNVVAIRFSLRRGAREKAWMSLDNIQLME